MNTKKNMNHDHNIIQIHNIALWDWRYLVEYSLHLVWTWGLFYRIMSVSQKNVMDVNNAMIIGELT